MPSLAHDFLFDVNFGIGDESVFTLVDKAQMPPLPPIEGYFLYLAGPPFMLLDGQNLALL